MRSGRALQHPFPDELCLRDTVIGASSILSVHPTIALPLGHVELRTSALLIQLAAGLGVIVGPIWAASLGGLDARRVRWAFLALAVIGLVGARFHFLLSYGYIFFAPQPLSALKLWTGPFHVAGGILSMAVAAPLVARRLGLPPGRFCDAGVPVVGVAIAIMRIGCFMQGCCFGNLCT